MLNLRGILEDFLIIVGLSLKFFVESLLTIGEYFHRIMKRFFKSQDSRLFIVYLILLGVIVWAL